MNNLRQIKKLVVHNVVGHRNGISGKGFYTLSFSYEEDDGSTRSAIATVDYEDLQCIRDKKRYDPGTRVLMYRKDNSGIDIEETMRGDWFHADLCRLLINDEDSRLRKVLKLKSGKRARHM